MLTMVDDGNKATGGLKKVCTVIGIVGFVKFLLGYYIYVITKAQVVAEIAGHSIYAIESTRLIPLDSAPERSQEERRIITTFSRIDLTKNFYFSYTYDLTNALQYNLTKTDEQSAFNEMFVWNYKLLRNGFGSISYSSPWILPLIHGYLSQNQLDASGRKIVITLIARRSRHFAGARFHKRGVNDEGFVANEVETEQMVFDASFNSRPSSGFTSFVQHRGSIPLYWSQDVSNMSPKPPIQINAHDPFYTATALHFDRMLSRYGSPLCLLNLVKHKESTKRESILLDEYGEAVRYLNQFLPDDGKIKYIAFDMSRASKSADQDVIGVLEKISEKFLQITKCFEYSKRHNEFQRGIVRTNCIDCLDRTNAAQFIMGKCALAHQLFSLAVIDKPELSMDCSAVKMLMEMYHDHGDIIALQYGGSALVNTMATYRKINAWSNQSRDMFESLKRYFSNSFTDAEKQDAINLFLGNFELKKSQEGTMYLELSGDFINTNQALEKSSGTGSSKKNYQQWYDLKNLTIGKQNNSASMSADSSKKIDLTKFEQTFDSYYSTWKYTSFIQEYKFGLLNARRNVDPFESPFRPSENKEPVGLMEIDDYSSESEDENDLYFMHSGISKRQQKPKSYPANSSAGLAEKHLKPQVKPKEAKEYERYMNLFNGQNIRLSSKDVGNDLDQYNVTFYSQYMAKFKYGSNSFNLDVDPKDYAIYQGVFDYSKTENDEEGYKRWLSTGKFY